MQVQHYMGKTIPKYQGFVHLFRIKTIFSCSVGQKKIISAVEKHMVPFLNAKSHTCNGKWAMHQTYIGKVYSPLYLMIKGWSILCFFIPCIMTHDSRQLLNKYLQSLLLLQKQAFQRYFYIIMD